MQGRSQDFLQEGIKFSGAQGSTPPKTEMSPDFFAFLKEAHFNKIKCSTNKKYGPRGTQIFVGPKATPSKNEKLAECDPLFFRGAAK